MQPLVVVSQRLAPKPDFNALQVAEELSHITGISTRSISDFARVTLKHIARAPSSL